MTEDSNLPARQTLPDIGDYLADLASLPLEVAQGLSDDDLGRAMEFVTAAEDYAEPVRLVIGAALCARRDGFARGEWTPYIVGFSRHWRRSSVTLGKWMLAAQRHYGLELPPAAHPTRRTEARPATGDIGHDDEYLAPVPIEATARPTPAPSSDVTKPVEPQVSRPRTSAEDELAEQVKAWRLAVDVVGSTHPVVAMKGAEGYRTQASTAVGALRSTLAATAQKAEAVGCEHAHVNKLAYGSWCLDCGARV